MKRFLTAGAILLLAGAGCSFLGDHEDSVLMPLDVGNTWTYLVSDHTDPVARRTYRVIDHIKDGDLTFAQIEIEEVSLAGDDTTMTSIYAINEVGLVFYEAPRLGSSVIDYFRYPIDRNDTYYSPNGSQMCTSTAEGIQVPAGSFDVIIYGPCRGYDENRTMFVLETGMAFSGDYEGGRAYHLSSFDLR